MMPYAGFVYDRDLPAGFFDPLFKGNGIFRNGHHLISIPDHMQHRKSQPRNFFGMIQGTVCKLIGLRIGQPAWAGRARTDQGGRTHRRRGAVLPYSGIAADRQAT